MVKTRDPTCCWDIFNTKGSSEEMLLRMFEEEEGVAVVRNDSNDEATPYISSKKPSTLLLNSAQTTNEHITAQSFDQKYSLVLNNRNNRNIIRTPIQHCPSVTAHQKTPILQTPQFNKTITGWDLCEATFNPELAEKQQPITPKFFRNLKTLIYRRIRCETMSHMTGARASCGSHMANKWSSDEEIN